MENNTKNLWWGYLHTNGGIHPKRYFDKRDIEEARSSDFVQFTHGPFEADTREEAIKVLEETFKIN